MLIIEIACGIVLGFILLNFLPYLLLILFWTLVLILVLVAAIISWQAIGGTATIGLAFFGICAIIFYFESEKRMSTDLKRNPDDYQSVDIKRALQYWEQKDK